MSVRAAAHGSANVADPAVVNESNRNRVQEVQLFASAPSSDHEPGALQDAKVFHHPDREIGSRRSSALSVCASSLNSSSSRVRRVDPLRP